MENYDEAILAHRTALYKRKDVFIQNITKHFHEKCKCKRSNKLCKCIGTIDLERLGNETYISELYDQGILDTMYNIIQSITQTCKNGAGKQFETCIEQVFQTTETSYDKQVFISDERVIYARRTSPTQVGHIVDFILPKPMSYPIHLDTYSKVYNGCVVSAKTNLRERWRQDQYLADSNLVYITLDKPPMGHGPSRVPCTDTWVKVDAREKNFTKWLLGLTPIKSRTKMNALDLFCGTGGFTVGLQKAGINVVAGIDIWDVAIDTYKQNHEHLALCKDLVHYPPEMFSAEHNIHKGDIDMIVGGPPCQGFSMAGRRDVNDPRNSLFMEFVKYLDFFQPAGFLMENVTGMLTMKTVTGEPCASIITTLLSEHYNITITKLYASDFGVPQNRRRVIIFGIRKDLNTLPNPPAPTTPERIPVSTVLLTEENVPDTYFLSDKAMRGIHTKKQRMLAEGKGFGAQFLNLDKPSYTIPARYWKDGYDALVRYSDTRIRRLTETELARIQTFPDDYKFCGSKREVIIQIGNAVACEFAYHITLHLSNLIRLPPSPVHEMMSVKELKQLCRQRKISGYSTKKKSELILLLTQRN